jgi:hypothetical protein
MLLEREGGNLAVTGVALVIAVGESRCKFSQVALSNCLTAQRTERLRAGVLPFTNTNFKCCLFIGLRLVFRHSRGRLGRPRSTA